MNKILHNFSMPSRFSSKKLQQYNAEWSRIKSALREIDEYGGGIDEDKDTPLEYEV